MKKIIVLFIIIGYTIAGCSKEQHNENSKSVTEINVETNSTPTMESLELNGAEEKNIFIKAIKSAKKEPGIVNIINPHYKFNIVEESYFLWLSEDSGTIMNTKDTNIIYSLSSNSVEEVYEFVYRGKLTKTHKPLENWEVREEFIKDEKVILTVAADSSLVAGKSFGYLFHFTEPFDTFEGKKLAVYATNKETGAKITVVSPKTIKEPSSGYTSLERFTANFDIPIGGLWRYEVFLDDKLYANVVFSVK